MHVCLARRARRRFAVGLALTLVGASLAGRPAQAQVTDSTRTRADSVAPVARPVGPVAVPAARGRFTPPLTPRRAFMYSALLPGLGQSRLDRGTSGALFAAVELSAFVMVRRSGAGLREARRYRGDSLPAEFRVGTGGQLSASGAVGGRYDDDLVRTRRLHVEDWLAVIAFNHLFAGADAFVSAQLWDIPVQLTAAPTANGPLFVATLRF